MGVTINSPTRAQLGGSTWLHFGAVNVTVQRARSDSPATLPESLPRPEGMSTATNGRCGKLPLMSRMTSNRKPSTGPVSPVPRMASTSSVVPKSSGRSLAHSSALRATAGVIRFVSKIS